FSDPGPVFHTIVSIKNDGHYFCRAGGNRPDGLNEPVTLYERGELVDVLWGELEWSSPTDDDELPEVTGPAWIVDKVAHYGG
ncbi:hypothetical protein OTG65_23080, partial [Escherichia coli]|nr:hypothetical protein [Escherichia coli]